MIRVVLLFLFIVTFVCIAAIIHFLPDNKKLQYNKGHQMAKVEIYTKSYCPYCVRAKELLKKKGVTFEEIDIEHDQNLAEKVMVMANGRKTVPQIFIDGMHVGGCDDLYALDSEGKLDMMLMGRS